MTSIYLAGKVAKGDWRHKAVPTLRGAWADGGYSYQPHPDNWPVLSKAAFGLDYTGPYFISCDHGCAHGNGSDHGCGANGEYEGGQPAPIRSQIRKLCLDAIRRSDIVFAWFDADDLTAYGTLVEIGYAHALGKKVIVASDALKPGTWVDNHGHYNDEDASPLAELWFAYGLDTSMQIDSPVKAVQIIAEENTAHDLCESPIERAFWREHRRQRLPPLSGLVPQHKVLNGRYRLDFALPARQIGIELDGYTYHSSKDAFVKDRARQRDLEAAGWRIIRFAGSEVTADPAGCVRQAAAAVHGYSP